MSYNGKEVIRAIGRIKNRTLVLILQYADRSVEIMQSALKGVNK